MQRNKKKLQHVIQAVWRRINSEGNKQCGDTQYEELGVWGSAEQAVCGTGATNKQCTLG